ncbi:MAG: FHA domain-containing protein [Alphaproteobacteria bacterium]|jgi:pSer/pThr/pTyr-binding forkhead associated (FHA) protein
MGTSVEPHRAASPASRTEEDRPALVKAVLQQLMTAEQCTDATVVLTQSAKLTSRSNSATQAQTFAELSAALLQSRWLEALAISQAVLRNGSESPTSTLHPQIAELRRSIEQQLLVSSTIDLVSETHRIHLLPRRSVLIGRPGGELPVDVAIDCRLVSRGERNLSLSCSGANWHLEDLGSTNGNFLDGSRLMPGTPVMLPVGQTQIQIGRGHDSAAPIMLEVRRPVKDPGAVVLNLRHTGSIFGMVSAWPTVEQDLARRWIVFRTQIGVAVDDDCALRIDGTGEGIAAAIRYQNGFWIVPSADSKVAVDGVEFDAPTPIPLGADLRIGNSHFCVELSVQSGTIENILAETEGVL